MKTKIILSKEELKNTEFSRFEIEIRLNDECKNGHDDFAITANGRYKNNTNKYDPWDIGGCCHEEILKLRPELKPFVDLHLSDSKGAPMYTIENGYYFLTTDTKEATCNYLRITSNEYDVLKNSGDKLHFVFQIQNLGIVDRWQREANEAIKLLESMTGEKYVDRSVKNNFKGLSEEETKTVLDRLENGYYSDIEIEKRIKQKAEDKKQKRIQYLTSESARKIQEINNDLAVALAIVNSGFSDSNFIYYTHTNEGVFNWLDFEKKLTPKDFDNFMKTVDFSTLPAGIKFKLK